MMGAFCLYPTLYLEQGGGRTLLARGYVPYERVKEALEAALSDAAPEAAFPEGAACGIDGCCDMKTSD